jgi:hypothetical protein
MQLWYDHFVLDFMMKSQLSMHHLDHMYDTLGVTYDKIFRESMYAHDATELLNKWGKEGLCVSLVVKMNLSFRNTSH